MVWDFMVSMGVSGVVSTELHITVDMTMTDKDSRLLWNAGNYLPINTESKMRRSLTKQITWSE